MTCSGILLIWFSFRNPVVKPDFYVQASKHKRNTNQILFPKKQKILHEYSIPHLTDKEQRKFDRELTLFFIDTSTSFLRVENVLLKKALQILRPDVIIPSRKSIGGANLDEIYNETSQKINSIVGSQGYSSTLLSDDWQNIGHEWVVNYCITNNQNTFFLESLSTTEDQSHSSKWLSTDLSKIYSKKKTNEFHTQKKSNLGIAWIKKIINS